MCRRYCQHVTPRQDAGAPSAASTQESRAMWFRHTLHVAAKTTVSSALSKQTRGAALLHSPRCLRPVSLRTHAEYNCTHRRTPLGPRWGPRSHPNLGVEPPSMTFYALRMFPRWPVSLSTMIVCLLLPELFTLGFLIFLPPCSFVATT